MELRSELRRELRRFIKPFKKSSSKPPFTIEELVVVTLFLGSSSGSSQQQVQRFITQHFRYYLDLALGCTPFATSRAFGLQPNSSNWRFGDFQKKCNLAYRQSEVPIVLENEWHTQSPRWTVASAATRVFLKDRLGRTIKSEEPQKPFPFLRLPAELRNRIYELVLQFPAAGVCVKVKTESNGKEPRRIPAQMSLMRDPTLDLSESWGIYSELEAAYKDYPKDCHPDHLPDDVRFCRSASTHLALLQVNKQVFEEAMPVFYSTNNFMFLKVKHLQWFLESVPAARRNHIEHVSFYFEDGDEKFASPAFKLLKDIPHLKELDIRPDERYWKRQTKAHSRELKYPDVLKVPGVFTLRSIHGLKAVRFHGDCETFKTLIPEMTSEKKVAKAPVKRPRKRKSQADAEYVEPTEATANDEENPDQSEPPKKKAKTPRKSKST